MRGRLFLVLLAACAPGIVFGALQAERNYRLTTRQAADAQAIDAERAAGRFAEAAAMARDFVAVGATRDYPSPRVCAQALSEALAPQARFSTFFRTDARGRVLCASSPIAPGIDVSRTPWFQTLKQGGPPLNTGLEASPLDGASVVITAAPMIRDGRFTGISAALTPVRWYEQVIDEQLGDNPGGVFIFDREGRVIGAGTRALDAQAANALALKARAARDGAAHDGALTAQRVTEQGGSFTVVSVRVDEAQRDIGWRTALIVLAPVLVAALSFIALWWALNHWVLQWFARLQQRAADFSVNRYAPAEMEGAPAEIATLARAFDDAVGQSEQRARDLGAALAANVVLTRELHHRVKNNLQVLSSLLNRQHRRADEPVVRAALIEARARMTPIALVYRYINPPEERTTIDLHPYLTELTRQLHVALGGEARGVKLTLNLDHTHASFDDAGNIGLIVAEAFVAGYANAAGMGAASAHVQWREDDAGGRALSVGVVAGASGAVERKLDREIILQLARQLKADARFDAPSQVTLNWPPPGEAAQPATLPAASASPPSSPADPFP